MSKVIITNFTDPLCPWCWGEEPYLRKIETHFPGQIEFRYVMGGLIEDLNKKKPTDETPESYYRKINISTARHLLETAQKHKMPIGTTDFQLYSETESSSYPTNIAFKAAEKANAGKAELFLYNLRAAAMA
ncbi:MAG: DsbA family protein, partial [Prevotella pleuritidis]|nr:DsbA family protein [Hoylesella pleuritidis]